MSPANVVNVILILVILSCCSAFASPRRKKMLVRRKIPITNRIDNMTIANHDKPIKIIKRKLINPERAAAPVLSSPLISETMSTTTSPSLLPQHKPFTVNETVAAKPDAVKRCKS